MPHLSKVAVVTSRLKRLVKPDDNWVVALRSVIRKIAADGAMLVVGEGTAGTDFIRHAADRLGVPYEVMAPPTESAVEARQVPLRDEIVLANAEVVYVLGLRSGGNLQQLLKDRLQSKQRPVMFVDMGDLQDESARRELCEFGATTWFPPVELRIPFNRKASSACDALNGSGLVSDDVYLVVPFPQDDHWEYLTHTTRSCPGPWPDETFETYADSLLESDPGADHSTLGTLRRIVQQKLLIASSRTIRGGHSVVSFSACPLGQLPSLHQFRPHLVRWDFEPYGICLRRSWLINQGVRPVSYGDESHWQSLAETDKPFFQKVVGESGIDWSVEREWRHAGNLDLAGLTSDDVLLFVPTFAAAKSLAQVTSWPITLWPTP